MIYRIRIDGFSDDASQLTDDFEVMASHFGTVGYLEGIVPPMVLWHDAESVIESMKSGEEVRVGGHRYGAKYKGRHTIEFCTAEGDFDALAPKSQGECEVHWTDGDHKILADGDALVLGRRRPLGQELVPTPNFDTVASFSSGGGSTDELLDGIRDHELVSSLDVEPVADGEWIVSAALVADGGHPVSSRQPKLYDAAADVYTRLRIRESVSPTG